MAGISPKSAGTGAAEPKDEPDEELIESEPERPPMLIDANETPELQYWDITMLAAIAYVSIATPYEVDGTPVGS